MRNIDYVLELLVAVKFVSSVLRSVVVWYLLLNNSINILPRPPRLLHHAPSPSS